MKQQKQSVYTLFFWLTFFSIPLIPNYHDDRCHHAQLQSIGRDGNTFFIKNHAEDGLECVRFINDTDQVAHISLRKTIREIETHGDSTVEQMRLHTFKRILKPQEGAYWSENTAECDWHTYHKDIKTEKEGWIGIKFGENSPEKIIYFTPRLTYRDFGFSRFTVFYLSALKDSIVAAKRRK